eukprot:Transcript_29573.p2 GENE.Transcript_29573~~Transcript_29573.p2  ORF type:complete len:410 (-),score=178.52 Transcript_29573:380-1561(-)
MIRSQGGTNIPLTGLSNIGNTCFINCTLQSLLHSPPAWHYLASQQHRRKGGCGGGFCMHCELERLAEQYRGGARYFAPRALVQSATRSGLFAMGDMHDSQEFYLHVLDGLLQANLRGKPTPPDPGPLDASLSKEELSKEKERRYDDKRRFEDALERQTLGFQLFGGTLLKAVTCSGCGHRIVRREPFKGSLELAVNKPGEEAPPEPRGLSAWVRGAASRVGYGAASAAAPPVSVEELLAEYNKAEVLEDYRCDGCGKKGCAETPPPAFAASSWISAAPVADEPPAERLFIRKQIFLCDVPPVFVLTLKRYSGSGRYSKISRHVVFEPSASSGSSSRLRLPGAGETAAAAAGVGAPLGVASSLPSSGTAASSGGAPKACRSSVGSKTTWREIFE